MESGIKMPEMGFFTDSSHLEYCVFKMLADEEENSE